MIWKKLAHNSPPPDLYRTCAFSFPPGWPVPPLWGTQVPHSVAVVVEEFKERDDAVFVRAALHVEKASQKPIVIGKGVSAPTPDSAGSGFIEYPCDTPRWLVGF